MATRNPLLGDELSDIGPNSRYARRPEPPQPPSPFFDGTRLGLEGTMVVILIVAIPGGLHIGLSTVLGYAVRMSQGLPAEPKVFSLMGFLFASLLAIIALSMVFFFVGAVPTMAYSVALVSLMLHWVGKRRGRERLAATIAGAILGLIMGVVGTIITSALMDLPIQWASYSTLFRWPAILSIDGIALLWLTVNPIANAVAGAQIGWRLGKQLEDLTMYYWYG
jgi:MFS family permease